MKFKIGQRVRYVRHEPGLSQSVIERYPKFGETGTVMGFEIGADDEVTVGVEWDVEVIYRHDLFGRYPCSNHHGWFVDLCTIEPDCASIIGINDFI